MIKINNSNVKEVLEVVLQYEKFMTSNSECVSSSDMRREIAAHQDVEKILSSLVEKGFDLEQDDIQEVAAKYDTKFKNGSDFKPYQGEFEIKFKSHLLDGYLEKRESSLLVEDEVIFDEKEFRKILEIGSSRFNYEFWDTSKESISHLYNNCTVFASAKKITEATLEEYGDNFKIKEIHCIRDTHSNNNSNCSSYMVTIVNEVDLDFPKHIMLLIQQGGFYQDIIILENSKLKSITKFDNAPEYSRVVSMDKVLESVKEYLRHRDTLMAAVS